jgi:Fibronectin type III-like domain
MAVSRATDGGLKVSVRVKNTGAMAGSAVPQVYLGAPSQQPAGVQFAIRQLVQFDRVTLDPGQSAHIEMHVPLRELQYWSDGSQQWITAAGPRTVYVGDADARSSLPLHSQITIPASSSITCENEQLSAVMVQGDVTVPRGDWCDLVDASVAGDVHVKGDGVRITGSTIEGNLVIDRVKGAADPLSSGTNVVCDTTVDGNLILHGSAKSSSWNLGLCGRNTIKDTS